MFSDRFRAVFGPFRAVSHSFRTVFFRFFASWRRGAAAEASQRRRCAVAAPPLEIFNAGPPPANSQSILFRNLLRSAGRFFLASAASLDVLGMLGPAMHAGY